MKARTFAVFTGEGWHESIQGFTIKVIFTNYRLMTSNNNKKIQNVYRIKKQSEGKV